MLESESYCFRVEERKLIPGVKKQIGGPFGVVKFQEFEKGFVLVDGRTERFLDKDGNKYERTYLIPLNNYYLNMGNAVNAAIDNHTKIKCTSPKCGWTKGLNSSEK